MAATTPHFPDILGKMSSRYVDVDALPWQDLAKGITFKVLMQDEERGLSTALTRWEPGAKLPLHEHVDIEQSFVLEGSLCDEEGECKAGQYVWRPAGSRHRAWSPNGCLLLAIFLKNNIFLEDPKTKPVTEAADA